MRERLSGLIAQIRELNQTEVYRPKPDANCRFCDFKPLCPLWPEGHELFPLVARRSGRAESSAGSASAQAGSS
jgi:hypothetical protein